MAREDDAVAAQHPALGRSRLRDVVLQRLPAAEHEHLLRRLERQRGVGRGAALGDLGAHRVHELVHEVRVVGRRHRVAPRQHAVEGPLHQHLLQRNHKRHVRVGALLHRQQLQLAVELAQPVLHQQVQQAQARHNEAQVAVRQRLPKIGVVHRHLRHVALEALRVPVAEAQKHRVLQHRPRDGELVARVVAQAADGRQRCELCHQDLELHQCVLGARIAPCDLPLELLEQRLCPCQRHGGRPRVRVASHAAARDDSRRDRGGALRHWRPNARWHSLCTSA
mmetsp:Transcript_19935/g.56345  ORF Transcript_19935/g.56345 Transcript_19935/m.56345 type:complete len:280 (+) Transcript_19935:194-1033(+)